MIYWIFIYFLYKNFFFLSLYSNQGSKSPHFKVHFLESDRKWNHHLTHLTLNFFEKEPFKVHFKVHFFWKYHLTHLTLNFFEKGLFKVHF